MLYCRTDVLASAKTGVGMFRQLAVSQRDVGLRANMLIAEIAPVRR